ncbi:FCD domain-containing protein [Shinella sp. PSBB067]|uniref:FCD domain-containing protein n=1 Tax=unclassified Shinella TaxID=2643062 RepID=UPI00193B44F4|nr:FCD domain-containing protein [Shinella sp. PSBB067]QRI63467.1 FCD domain-containing protein [Shinella sp. PSBB067]
MDDNTAKDESAAEKTARHIEMLILEGSLSPGDHLLPERELAQRLDVSRPTLRQAIRILEDRGLILSRDGSRSIAPLGTTITDPLMDLMAHSDVVDDYLEFRATTEKMAAQLAARRANDVDRAQLKRCMERIDEAHERGSQQDEGDADVDLHIAVYEASHNLVVLHVMRALSGMLRRGVIENREKLFQRPETRDALRAQHRAIYEGVMAGDAEAAGQAAEAHIHYTHRALKEVNAAEARLGISLRRIGGGSVAASRRR